MPERVRITDVSPRDGLQNEPGVIASFDKAFLVKLLSGTGVDEIEVTSFVSAKWVPQLGDAAQVLVEAADSKSSSVLFSALVPNERGMADALEAMRKADPEVRSTAPSKSIDKVSVFTAASETFSLRNTNASIWQSIQRFPPVIQSAQKHSLLLRGYLSCAIACPFEGPIAPTEVAKWALTLYRMGIPEIDLGDTIGAATPETVGRMIRTVQDASRAEGADPILTLHLHDTFHRAADCVKAALDLGIRSFDGSVAGLGGCPYASTPGNRAPGNIDTALLVRTIHDAGYETNVDLDKLEEAAAFARQIVANARAADGTGGPCA